MAMSPVPTCRRRFTIWRICTPIASGQATFQAEFAHRELLVGGLHVVEGEPMRNQLAWANPVAGYQVARHGGLDGAARVGWDEVDLAEVEFAQVERRQH